MGGSISSVSCLARCAPLGSSDYRSSGGTCMLKQPMDIAGGPPTLISSSFHMPALPSYLFSSDPQGSLAPWNICTNVALYLHCWLIVIEIPDVRHDVTLCEFPAFITTGCVCVLFAVYFSQEKVHPLEAQIESVFLNYASSDHRTVPAIHR